MGKFLQLFRLFHPKNTKTLLRLKKFVDLNPNKIEKNTGKKIEGLIIDADECIAFNHGDILPENVAHIKELHKEGIKMIIFSNMKRTNRYDVLGSAVKILTDVPPKPEPEGFIKAIEILGCDKDCVAMVGDNYITDAGSIRLGIDFIKIKPIKSKEKLTKKIKRIPPMSMRWFFDKISRLYGIIQK